MRYRLLATCSVLSLAIMMPASAQQSSEEYTYDSLGRLVVSKTAGGENNNETHSLCFDAAGNRTNYHSTSDGSLAGCVDTGSGSSTPTPTPSPTPTPTPTPSNNPPTTTNDSISGQCFLSLTTNVIVNDTDPEGNYPLVLQSVSRVSGQAGATKVSDSSVRVDFGPSYDISTYNYSVRDSLGATSQGQLTIRTTSCGGGGMEP